MSHRLCILRVPFIIVLICFGCSATTAFGQSQKQFYNLCRTWSETASGASDFDSAWNKTLSLRQRLEDIEFGSADLQNPILATKKILDEDLALLGRMAQINGSKPSGWDHAGNFVPFLLKEEPTSDEKADFVIDLLKTAGAELALSELRTQHCKKLRELYWQLFQFVAASPSQYRGSAPTALLSGCELSFQKSGAIISTVIPGSPAEKAAFPVGSIIESINGTIISSKEDIRPAANNNSPTAEDVYRLKLTDGTTKTFRVVPKVIELVSPLGTIVRRSWPGVWNSERFQLINGTHRDLSNPVIAVICRSQGQKGFPVTFGFDGTWESNQKITLSIRRNDTSFTPGFWSGVYSQARVIVISPETTFFHDISNVDEQHDAFVQQEVDARTLQIGYLNREPGIFEPWNRGASIRFDGSRLPVEQVTIRFHNSDGQTKGFRWDSDSLSSNTTHSYRTEKWVQPPVAITADFQLAETSYRPSWKIKTPRANQADR